MCSCQRDYRQIELRLLAHVADIPQLKQAFADGVDIHARTASEMFGVPVEGMPKEIRANAKAINFGIIYGISAFGLARNLGIEREEAGAYIKKYFERFPGIRDYMEDTKAFARANGYVQTIFGRRIWVEGMQSKNHQERAFGERQSINAPLQGAAADIIRRAMVRLPPALRDGQAQIAHAAASARRTRVRSAEGRSGQALQAGERRDGSRARAGGRAQRAADGGSESRRDMGRGALIRATILLSSLGLFGCAHFGDVAPMTRAECSSAQVCTVRGVVRARQAEGAWMGVMDMEGERCIAISLPPQFADRLRREGPREMTVRGEVWPDPSRDS